ncbi:MAG: hypothetical protein HY704_11180 [Gemmatimonadetes bacterium]|nr:hypothetical protein [Gemmatimonadota bacterium]
MRIRSSFASIVSIVAVLGVTLVACRDAPVEPSVLLVAGEARAAVSLQGEVPSLPGLARDLKLEAELGTALELWMRGWTLPEAEGAALREAAYAEAIPVLAGALAPAAVDSLLTMLDRWRRMVAGLNGGALPGPLGEAVVRILEELAAGRRALSDAVPSLAILSALRASDLLRGVSSPVVADMLIRDAAQRLAERPDTGAAPLSVRRARRLVQGARHAFEAGDFDRAIRRAYYATRLLEAPADGRPR